MPWVLIHHWNSLLLCANYFVRIFWSVKSSQCSTLCQSAPNINWNWDLSMLMRGGCIRRLVIPRCIAFLRKNVFRAFGWFQVRTKRIVRFGTKAKGIQEIPSKWNGNTAGHHSSDHLSTACCIWYFNNYRQSCSLSLRGVLCRMA